MEIEMNKMKCYSSEDFETFGRVKKKKEEKRLPKFSKLGKSPKNKV